MIPIIILDKTQPQEQRRHRVNVPSIESLLAQYNDEDKYIVYVNGKLINVIIKEPK